ncbi:hypothetical protein MHU86_20517 [Fragilaria crotonensis]|nr:hypothetical protein MHU86_20517 [Fragilaria crotonensis]
MISDGKKLPRWTPRSTRTVNLGFSDKHASSVPLVLNPQTGYITPQFHIVFDDWFATVPASADDLPNFNDDCWQRMFRDSTFQYVLDDEDEERLIAGSTDYEQANELLSQMQRVATALDNATPPQVLPVAPPPLSTPLPPPREQIATPPPVVVPPPPATPLLTPRRRLRNRLRRLRLNSDSNSSQTLPIVADSNSSCKRKRQESERATSRSKATKAKSTPVKHEPRRSTRNRSAPVRLGYDGQQGHGYIAESDGTSSNGCTMKSPSVFRHLPRPRSPGSATARNEATRPPSTLVRYLHRTSDMGMIVKPTGTLDLDCYVDADFAGLHGRDPDRSPTSAKSRTGYIITLGGCPILWKSHLQSEISLSTLEAEYSAQLRDAYALALRSMLQEVASGIKLPRTFTSTIKCQVFEDNNGALLP